MHVPLQAPSFTREQMVKADIGSITVSARAITGPNANWELFDDDLPHLGIAAVWISLWNGSTSEVNLSGLKWRLSVGSRRYNALEPEEVLKRYYKGKQIRLYGLNAHQQATRELQEVSFQQGRLPPSKASKGFLFFRIDPKMAGRWSRESSLIAEGLPAEGSTEGVLRLPLEHADR